MKKSKKERIKKGFGKLIVYRRTFMGEEIIHCPKCNIKMGKKTNGKFIIDACPRCKGIFLDKSEIDNIAHQGFFNYVMAYFRRPKKVEAK